MTTPSTGGEGMWGRAPECVKSPMRTRKHTHTHARTHNADLGPRRHWTKPRFLQDKQGGTWRKPCPGTQSQNPKLRRRPSYFLREGPQPTHFLFPALSTMTGISRSHCVPSEQTSIPAPPHQSKYCKGMC